MVKLLYLVNITGQLFLLDMFLGTPFHAYGIEVRDCSSTMFDFIQSMPIRRFTQRGRIACNAERCISH